MNSFRDGYRILRPSVIALAVAAMPCVVAVHAHAQAAAEQRQSYQLPSAPLDRTLLQIAAQSGVLIAFDPAQVRALVSPPVVGTFSAAEAFRRALEGSGFEVYTTASGSLALRRAAAAPVSTPTAAPAATVAPAPARPRPAPREAPVVVDDSLPIVTVVAQRDSGGTGFAVESSSTYTRGDTSLRETPKAITVVNAAVIQSQSAADLTDVLRNAAGVVGIASSGQPTFNVRGFVAPVAEDGMSLPQEAVASVLTPMAAIASVEVIKGPSAILAGNNPPGGVINIVKKMPQVHPFKELQAEVGPDGRALLGFDATGALTADKKLRYRFTVSGNRADRTAMGYDGGKGHYIAPTLQWKDQRTDLTLAVSQTVNRAPRSQFTVGIAGGGLLEGFLDYPLGNEADGFEIESRTVGVKLEQEITDSLDFVSHLLDNRSTQESAVWAAITPIAANNSLRLFGISSKNKYTTTNFKNYLRLYVDRETFDATLLFGADLRRGRVVNYSQVASSSFTIPDFRVPTAVPPLTVDRRLVSDGDNELVGGYVQVQANRGPFHFLGSVRYDDFESEATRYAANGNETKVPPSGQAGVSTSLGVLYDLTPWLSAYVSHNEGFQPNMATTSSGEQIDPKRSTQLDAGLKFGLRNGKLQGTVALYRNTYVNEPVADPASPGSSIGVSGAVAKGIELELQGQLRPGWNVSAQYAYMDYQQPPTPPPLIIHFPRHKAGLWLTHNFSAPALQGFGVGAGLFYGSGERVSPTTKIPSQLQADLGLFYRRQGLNLNLSVKNLFDRANYNPVAMVGTNLGTIPMGTPRTVTLTAAYSF
ncbi:MAG: TonB-dependent receptor [Rubrivivax sp.]|nr:TonB-dependent receptor [Rubrivivax sp.]